MGLTDLFDRKIGPDALHPSAGQEFEGIRKRISPSQIHLATPGPGHQTDVAKGDSALVDQADRHLALIGAPVKKADELPLVLPLATDFVG
jgi:hypothetical protein